MPENYWYYTKKKLRRKKSFINIENIDNQVRRTESRIRLNRKCQQNQVTIFLLTNKVAVVRAYSPSISRFSNHLSYPLLNQPHDHFPSFPRCSSSLTACTLIARMPVNLSPCVGRLESLRSTWR